MDNKIRCFFDLMNNLIIKDKRMKTSDKIIRAIQICSFAVFMNLLYSGGLIANNDSTKTYKMNMRHSDHKKDINHMDMRKKDNQTKAAVSKKELSIIRKGIIDIKTIDKNKDGKVFQDQMDWNVISDKPGSCPLCKMTLKEVTLETAKENLKNNGFKVK